jgi:hypothetical protein
MTTRTDDARQRIREEDLPELLRLLKGADSCELKLSIPNENQRATITGLPLDPVEAQPRQVFFFDTPNLDLNKAGVVVRARRIQGGRGDTVVKLRPVVPDQLPPEVRKSGSLNVEVDVIPGGFVCSAAMKGKATGDQIRVAIEGGRRIRKLFTREQRAFYASRAPAGVDLDSLTVLGPTFVLKSQFTPPELGRRMVAELWFYPDGSRILELSTKALPEEAFGVAVEARAYLSERGITVGGVQQTKTRAALDYFSEELDAAGSPSRLRTPTRPARPATSTAARRRRRAASAG